MKNIIPFIIFIISFTASAQIESGMLLKSLQNKFNSYADFTTSFSQNINGKQGLSGTFFYKRRNKIRIELNNITIVSDGITTWNYAVKKKKVIISNYDQNDQSLISLDKYINEYPSKCIVKEGKTEQFRTLILTSTNPELNFKEAIIFINTQNMIDKLQLVDMNNQKSLIEFFNFSPNKNLSDSKFTFVPQKETTVIDLR
jgi:outer membrane lipoprotein-sorting protein